MTYLLSYEFMGLLKEHLNPGGVIYVNTTRSSSSMRTIASSFKYVGQYGVYIVASDSPLAFDYGRFENVLKDFKIDSRPVLDLSKEADRSAYRKLTALRIKGSREEFLKRTEGDAIIRDDNMVTEFNFLKKWIEQRGRMRALHSK